jgi:hypothetical protein
MEEALADLRKKYEQQPNFELGRMIQQIEAEIAIRKRLPKTPDRVKRGAWFGYPRKPPPRSPRVMA